MKIILDTHTFLWFINDSPELSNSAAELIESDVDLWISIASLWEIAIKLSIGKLSLRSNYESIETSLEPAGIELLPISFANTVRVMNLPLHHRDPFDRILIAQAIDLFLTLVSCDAAFAAYPIQIKWG